MNGLALVPLPCVEGNYTHRPAIELAEESARTMRKVLALDTEGLTEGLAAIADGSSVGRFGTDYWGRTNTGPWLVHLSRRDR